MNTKTVNKRGMKMNSFDYDVIIIGAGPGGIFSAYELATKNSSLKIGVFEAGNALSKRKCPIDGEKVKSCIIRIVHPRCEKTHCWTH